MGVYYVSKFIKGNQVFVLVIGQDFVVDQVDIFFQDCLQEFLVIRLFFDGMREKEIGFVGDQLVNGYFFDVYQYLIGLYIFCQFYVLVLVGFIWVVVFWGRLNDDIYIFIFFYNGGILFRNEWNVGVWWDFIFMDNVNFYEL